jgi:hypothetical protein
VHRGADHLDVPASAVRGAPELVVPDGLERLAEPEISIAEYRVEHWPWDAPAGEGSHARQAAKDSNSVWEQASPKKWDVSSRHVVPRQPGKSRVARTKEAASQPASTPMEPMVGPVLEAQGQLQQAVREISLVAQRAQRQVLRERAAVLQELQASAQSLRALEPASSQQERVKGAQPGEQVRIQREREEQRQQEVLAEAPRRQASSGLL